MGGAPLDEEAAEQPVALRASPRNDKKVVHKHVVHSLVNKKHLLSYLMGKEVTLVYANALSLAKYGFNRTTPNARAGPFLTSVEREVITRYRAHTVYMRDIAYIAFISLFLKKPQGLVDFVAFALGRLPRQWRETTFIRSIIKVMFMFAGQRREIVGLLIRFKGRVNKWNRTKYIRRELGHVRSFRFEQYIVFANSTAFLRKGALGIRLWLSYERYWRTTMQGVIRDYVTYSKQMRLRAMERHMAQFRGELRPADVPLRIRELHARRPQPTPLLLAAAATAPSGSSGGGSKLVQNPPA